MAKFESVDGQGGRFVKLTKVGDKARGEFVRLGERESPWGKKTALYLKNAQGLEFELGCTESLAKTLKANEKALTPGVMVTVELEELVPSNKGNPYKRFSVDVAGPGETGEVKGDADESIPF
jgi:hypothetical protein